MHSDDGDFNIHEELLLQEEEAEAESEVASSTQLSMSVLEESHIRIRPRRKRPVRVWLSDEHANFPKKTCKYFDFFTTNSSLLDFEFFD